MSMDGEFDDETRRMHCLAGSRHIASPAADLRAGALTATADASSRMSVGRLPATERRAADGGTTWWLGALEAWRDGGMAHNRSARRGVSDPARPWRGPNRR